MVGIFGEKVVLRDAANRLETAVRSGDSATVRDALVALEECLAEFQAALASLRNEHGNSGSRLR